MPTPRRILYPGAIYHVTVKAIDGLWPFKEPVARELVLVDLAKALAKFDIECHGYVVMSNHFHLLLRTPTGGLPNAMQQLNSTLAKRFNRDAHRRGPVLESPYHTELIERQGHLLEVARYDVLNPVRAAMVTDPGDYEWSSYRVLAGLASRRPRFLTTSWILDQLGGAAGYRAFVAEGAPARTVPGLLLAA
jgi:REP element-mobilizing transposase RayT